MPRRSIHRRLLIVFLGLTGLSVLLTGGVLGWRGYQLNIDQVLARQQELARRVGVQVQAALQRVQDRLKQGIRLSDFTRLDERRRTRVLERLLSDRKHFREIQYLAPDGSQHLHLSNVRLLGAGHPDDPAADGKPRIPPGSGRAWFSPVYYNPSDNEPLMRMGLPVSDPRSGRSAGMLVAEVRFKPVWELISSLKLGDGEAVYLLDRDGRVIAHRNPSVVLRGTRLSLRPGGRRQSGLGPGEVYLAVYGFELGQQTFRVVAERNAVQAALPALAHTGLTAAAMLLALIAALALLLPISRRITRPIEAVSEAARAIRDGDLERQVAVPDSADEIAELARSFNAMTARLRSSLEELAAYREHLEGLVAERTADLESANRRQRQIQYAMDKVGIAIHWVDREHRLRYVNEQACHMLGYSRAELTGRRIPELESDFQAEQLQSIQDQVMEKGFARFESHHRHRDGRLIPVEVTAYFLGSGEEGENQFINFVTDISRRKAEQALLVEAKEAAEAANRAKSVFLANMSHELRTPLNAILGFAQLMARDERIPPQQRENLRTIDRSGQHLLALINDVLEISRIETGRIALAPQPFDLRELLASLVEVMTLRARDKGLVLRTETDPALPDWIDTDLGKLRQVLLNLLSNAVKYTRQGEVVLSAAPVAGAGEARTTLRFVVRDTGEGIAADDLERVFQPFYQTEQGIRLGEGTGLGLAICREYTQVLGGHLTAHSEPGAGSRFQFEIPVKPTQPPPASPPPEGRILGLAPGQPAKRILVAEDNPDNARLISELLAQAGFQVRNAGNGREAVRLFREWRPHLVWMDMRMPEMDGFQATRAIRALPGGAGIPILALTASAFEEDRAGILEAGCNDALTKPVDEQALFRALGHYLRVEFVYAQEAPTGTEAQPPDLADEVATLPPALRERIQHLALLLDGEALKAVLDELEPEHSRVAAHLRGLLDAYRFEQIQQLLQNATSPKGAPQ